MAENKAGLLSYVTVGDVAEAHLRALKPEIKENASYLVSGPTHTWDDVLEIVKSHYPGVPYKLKPGTKTINFVGSTEKAEKELGMEWQSLKSLVHEVMDQQLGFLGNGAPNIWFLVFGMGKIYESLMVLRNISVADLFLFW